MKKTYSFIRIVRSETVRTMFTALCFRRERVELEGRHSTTRIRARVLRLRKGGRFRVERTPHEFHSTEPLSASSAVEHLL